MITIYEAADGIDAQRVVDLLASEGIAAHATGTYLAGAIGEVPAGGLVRVWVDDTDAEAARAVLAEDAAAPPFVHEDDEPAAPVAAAAPRSLMWPVFGSLLVGGVLGFGVAELRHDAAVETLRTDSNGDLQPDYFEEFRGEVLQTIRVDRNFDGQVDQITENASRSDSLLTYDDDFDGRFEVEARYANWQPASVATDLDGDGTYEWLDDYKHGALRTATLRDPDTDAIVKRITYVSGFPVLEEFDADGDGTLETVRHFDGRGEVKP